MNPSDIDAGKIYVISGDTLKKLLVRVVCDEDQFDVVEDDTTRTYTLRATIPTPPSSGGYVLKSVDGVMQWQESFSGSLLLKDCTGAVCASLDWTHGVVTTEGAMNFEGGCDTYSS